LIPILFDFSIFETNDDFGMMLLVEGSISGKPEEYLGYTSEVLGIALKTLYDVFPNITWYPLIQLVMKVISSYALIRVSINMLKSIRNKALRMLFQLTLIVIPILIYPEFWYSYQFTATSIIASGSGLLYLVFSKGKSLVLSLFLISLGILLRPESGVLILTFLILTQLSLSYFINGSLKISFKAKYFISLSFFLFIIMMLLVIPKRFSDPEVLTYQEFNSARGEINGYNPSPSVVVTDKQAKKIVNWSKNDYSLFTENFFYGDQKVYSSDKLQKLIETQKSNLIVGELRTVPRYFLTTFFSNYKYSILILTFLVFILLNIVSYLKHKNLFTFILLSPFLLFGYFFVIHIQGRLPGRIFFPSLVIFSFYITFVTLKSASLDSQIVSKYSGLSRKALLTPYIKFYNKFLILVWIILFSIVLFLFLDRNIASLTKNSLFVIIITFLISISYLTNLYINNSNIYRRLLLLVCLFFLLSINLGKNAYYFENINYLVNMRKYDLLNYKEVYNYRGDKPIVAFSSFYSPLMEYLNPFDAPNSREKFFRKVVFIGSHLYSPAVNSQLKNNNISTSLFMDVALGDALLGVGNNLEIQKVSQFVLEHYEIKISWPITPIYYSSNNIQIWSIN
jgi:hypothetical protein